MDGAIHERLRVGACLSLSGQFSRFGRQAARALEVWTSLDGAAEVVIEDDRSDVGHLKAVLLGVAERSDLLLGPYSTMLMRVAGDIAAAADRLVWNHGGSGDDVETAHPGHVVSILTPTSRYVQPFVAHLTAQGEPLPELRIVHGKGRFGRQVADGARRYAQKFSFGYRVGSADAVLSADLPRDWVLISAGTFEEDVETVTRAQGGAHPPRLICAVAAGVREFGEAVKDPEGVFGIAQWFPGIGRPALLGPSEGEFLRAYHAVAGEPPGYPAVQALAGAVLAAHCARQVGSTETKLLWNSATALDSTTLFGPFKIDCSSGAQIAHRTVLVRWSGGERVAIPGDLVEWHRLGEPETPVLPKTAVVVKPAVSPNSAGPLTSPEV